MPTLTICIPTYNRSRCLAELLDSIVAQDLPELQVVVSDDASPDDTAIVAERYRDRIASFTFIRQPVNIGLDRNFQAVVDAATGDYVWLMGDDDRLEPGGAARVLEALDRWPGIVGLTLGVIDYDVTMRHVTGVRGMPETQRIEGAGVVFSRIPELLGFMSAMVVDRVAWQRASDDPAVRAMKNLYTQVFVIGRALGRTGQWGVVREACVGFRSGNDQFASKYGWLERLRIDVRAYEEICARLFAGDPAARGAMRRRIFDTHVMARILNAKTASGRTIGTARAALYLLPHYSALPHYWTRALPMLFAPGAALRRARAAYKRFAPSSGAARARAIEPIDASVLEPAPRPALPSRQIARAEA